MRTRRVARIGPTNRQAAKFCTVLMGLTDYGMGKSMLKLVIFIPQAHAEDLKQSLWETGLGRQGDYRNCAFTTRGFGEFMPLGQADPHLGSHYQQETVEELRIEMLCPDEFKDRAVEIIRSVHPYEEPAYEFYTIIH